MAKSKATFNLLVVAGLFFLVLSFSGCGKSTNISNGNQGTNTLQQENLQLERSYEQDLKQVLAPYWQTRDIAGVRDKILNLKAPAKYLDLHLNLVIAFDLLEQGQKAGDETKTKSGLDKLSQLKDSYNWLE
ncbi:MAG: hypothetical protein WC508_05400 [Patescibacteria group bacterium]